MDTISFTDVTAVLPEFLYSKGRQEATVKSYLTDAKMFFQEMELEELPLVRLEAKAAEWLNKYRRIVAPKTTHRRLTSMKNLGLAYGITILTNYSTPTPPKAKPHPLPNGLTDLQKLLDVCLNDDHRALVAMCGLVGMRISEARSITPSDFDYAERTVTIWGKGNKVREVPVSPKAWEILMPKLIDASIRGALKAPLVQVGDRSARDIITRLGVRAGISRPISSHDLRATFATESFRKTLNIRAVQELLGHASSKQTELYILVSDKELRAAASIME